MNKTINLITGIILTVAIFGACYLISEVISIENDFIPASLVTHSSMLLLAVIAILYCRKYSFFKFPLKKVKLKYYLFGILLGLAGMITGQILSILILKISGFGLDPSGQGHSVVANLNALQFFLFIFLLASISEEFLFRGFTQNFFSPLKSIGIRISQKVFIGLPAILTGVLFGLGHLILLTTETSGPMIFRIVVMTSVVGIIAGYFQEKHQSILPAIVIHMTVNLPGLITSILLG